MILLLAVLLFTGNDFARAADPTLESFEDYYTVLSQQIRNMDRLKYYKVSSDSLGKAIVHQDLDTYANHYNASDPLMSGCYLVYYIDTVYYTYSSSMGLKVLIKFNYGKETMDAHFDKMKSISEQLKGETEFDTVKNVHDYLIENFEYDYSTSMVNHTDIEGFRDGRMVCSGYSLAAFSLLTTAGVEVRTIIGYGGQGQGTDSNHMWNMVKVDGNWYNMDITWDDKGGDKKEYTYFLKSDAEFPDHIRLGDYTSSLYVPEVAAESYKLPFSMRFREYLPRIFYASVMLFAVIFVSVNYVRRIKQATSVKPGEEIPRPWEADGSPSFDGVERYPYPQGWSGNRVPYGPQYPRGQGADGAGGTGGLDNYSTRGMGGQNPYGPKDMDGRYEGQNPYGSQGMDGRYDGQTSSGPQSMVGQYDHRNPYGPAYSGRREPGEHGYPEEKDPPTPGDEL